MILENLAKNAEIGKKMLKNAIRELPEKRGCECKEALRNAIVTRKEAVSAEVLERLKPIVEGFI